jgi:glycosyltransferase involved in cell wall biosynthesis
MPVQDTRILVICHATAAGAAVAGVRRAYCVEDGRAGATGDLAGIDVLCYGLAGDDLPPPPGARLVGPLLGESTGPWGAIRMIVGLRRRSYQLVVLSQPALGRSRARGVLVALAYLIARHRAVILDPIAGCEVGPIGRGMASRDLGRWVGFQVAAGLVAAIAPRAITRLADRAVPATSRPGHGSVAYLRTDLELKLAPLAVGGSAAHTAGVVEALIERGHDVAYWGTGGVDGVPAGIPQVVLPALLKGNVPTEVAELVSGIIQGAGRRPWHSSELVPTGFIYQRYSLNNLCGVILSRRWGVPLVLEANASEAKWRKDFGTLRYAPMAFACERLVLGRASVIAAVSANAAADLVAAGADPDRVRVVPNGVAVKRFAAATPIALPADLDGAFVVCFVGLFYPWHGVRFLAEAFALLHARVPRARLLLVGDGEEAPVVRALLDRRGVLAAAHFAGLVARVDAPRYMAAADVLVSPHADVDRFIGSPIKLFEYMAAGKPIVATRVGQIPAILADEESGLLVAPEDPRAMADALHRLHADRALGARLAATAQAQARDHHSWDARLAAILDDRADVSPAGSAGFVRRDS